MRLLAARPDQEAHLRLGLDTLGDDLKSEFMGEADGGAHHGGVAIVDGYAEHELLSELQPVHGIGREIFERRISRAEIIDGDLGAELAEIFERVLVTLRRLHQDRLGQLELEPARIEAPARQASSHLALKLRAPLELNP